MKFIFWKLYVLPWGQISFWAATVITNLLSAIPWIGKDFVEFPYLDNIFICSSILSTIGTVNNKALRRTTFRTDDEKLEALNISYSFLSMLIYLIDDDGYISIIKTSKGYIRIQLVISLDIRNLDLINYIHSVLKGIEKYPKINTVKLIISRIDFKIIVFPLIIHYNLYFLTNTRQIQFNRAIFFY